MEAVKLKTSGSRTKSPSTIFITKYCLSAFAATAAETGMYSLYVTKAY